MQFSRSTAETRILLISNDDLMRKSLYEMLCCSGYGVDTAESIEQALTRLDEKTYHVILADIKRVRKAETLLSIKRNANSAEIIVLSSSCDLKAAIDCIKMGAFDYLPKPVKDERILSSIKSAMEEKRRGSKKRVTAKRPPRKENTFCGLVGNSQKAHGIYTMIERVANSKTTILLHGESGTGKRLIAQAIHKIDKKRRHKPFVEISCGALPREIIESELFGHTKGAFTGAVNDRKGRFELANSGTLLLDDIDSLPPDLQVKLLRVLQQKEFERVGDHKTIKVDVRIIATTNQDIKKAVEEKRFREDLYYRLDVISIEADPLRERKQDLPLLVEHFLELYSKENHKKTKGISQEAVQVLADYDWPGNIRELENIIERAVILDTDGVIDTNDLPEILLNIKANLLAAPNELITRGIGLLKDALQDPEKGHILRILKEVGWNKKRAAERLGINRTTLYNKMRKYNLLSHISGLK